MSTYREIVTKAVVGKAKKSFKNDFSVLTNEKPDTVLGCWVINHKFKGTKNSSDVIVNGSFDVNVWYSYDNDSKTTVEVRNFTYDDTLNMNLDKLDIENEDIIIKALKQPTVADVNIKEGVVYLTIEKELGVEVVGNTKVKIAVEDSEDDDYDEIIDIENDPELDEISEDYLK